MMSFRVFYGIGLEQRTTRMQVQPFFVPSCFYVLFKCCTKIVVCVSYKDDKTAFSDQPASLQGKNPGADDP